MSFCSIPSCVFVPNPEIPIFKLELTFMWNAEHEFRCSLIYWFETVSPLGQCLKAHQTLKFRFSDELFSPIMINGHRERQISDATLDR